MLRPATTRSWKWQVFGPAMACLFLTVGSQTRADDPKTDKAAPPATVSYYRDVRPIFQENCQGCHQPAKPSGEYVITSLDLLRKGGESGDAAVVPGKADQSNLMKMITVKGEKAEMPKGKPPLAPNQVELISRWIAAGAEDDTPASAKRTFDADHPPTYQAPPVLTSVAFSPDGKLLAVSGYHEVLLHKADGSELVARLIGMSERIQSMAFSPDGTRLAVFGGSPARFGEVQIWDVATRKLTQSTSITFDTIYGGSWSPDGSLLAFGCADNTVRAIDAKTGAQVLYQGAHSDWVLGTAFSVDGAHLVSVSRDRTMKLIEVATQRFVDNITSITPGALKGGIGCIDRHPKKDEVVVGGADGVPKIYRMFREKGKDRKIGDDFNLIRAFELLPGRVFSVRYSPDGTRIVVGSSNDGEGEIRVYQVEDGKLISKYDGKPGSVYAVAFSSDGETVAAGGFEGHVLLINATSGKLIKDFVPVPLAANKVAANAQTEPKP